MSNFRSLQPNTFGRTRFLLSSLITLIIILVIAGCSMNATSQSGKTPFVEKSVMLKDANGNALGYVTETTADSVTVLTSKNYFVSLTWNGALTDWTCWYTGANGAGTMFYIAADTEKLLGFAISVNGQAYVAASVDASGCAVPNSSISGFQSYYSGNGTIRNATGTVPPGHIAYPLEPISFEYIGMPASISVPRELVFQ
jgi:hypothetical protein